ncbi:MAG: cation-translocating P-type ATPase [Candidatus Hodarchaeales archaeon]
MSTEHSIPSTSIPGFDIPASKLYVELSTDIKKGLTDQEVSKRLEATGLNVIPKVKPSLIQIYIAPLLEVMIVVYLIMAGLLVILTIWDPSTLLQAAQWVGVVALNFTIAIVQQARAQKKMDALQKLSAATSRVVRNGKVIEVETETLVPGDLIQLSQGDSIPTDARIISSSNFIVNEASLTGESVPVTKFEDGSKELPRDTPIGERGNMVYKGTFVQIGTASAVVVNTGKNTQLGRISTDLAELNTGEIPLRKKVNALGKVLSLGVVSFLIIQIIWNYLELERMGLLDQTTIVVKELVSSIIVSMSLMPINIPLLTTIVLITGVLAMATHRVIIRNLSAIESLGRISVLCSDKTGTITKSQMTVKRIWDGKQMYGVTGIGYGPSGVIFPVPSDASAEVHEEFVPDELFAAKPRSSLELLLISGLMNNESELIVEDVLEATGQSSWKATGSPTDAALLAVFNKTGIDKSQVFSRFKEERSYPFDSSVKRMTKIVTDNQTNQKFVFTKGAIEVLLDKCTGLGLSKDIQPLDPEKRKEILDLANTYAAQGFRVLTFCTKEIKDLPQKAVDERDKVESDLNLLGFVCLLDPPREGVRDSVSECIGAGITPIMITGDSPVTAATIAKDVGIINNPEQLVHEGKMASRLTDDEFFRTTVFARVSPKDKQIIVERYQKRNKVVAMTGDGVNDALALSMSDAGICMGIAGTDVAKQASDLVIADDSFNSIVTGVRQGRGLFQKIRMMIFFYIGINLAEAFLYFGTSFISGFELLNTWQRIYIFAIAHSLPPLAIIFDKNSGDIMEREPLDTAGIFHKQLLFAMVIMSISLSIVAYIAFFSAYTGLIPINEFNTNLPLLSNATGDKFGALTNSHAKARTMLHTTLFIAEAILVLSMRRMNMNLFDATFRKEGFWFVWVAVFSLPLLHILVMYTPIQQIILNPIGITFEIIQLGPTDWIVCLILGLTPVVTLESFKYYKRKQGIAF